MEGTSAIAMSDVELAAKNSPTTFPNVKYSGVMGATDNTLVARIIVVAAAVIIALTTALTYVVVNDRVDHLYDRLDTLYDRHHDAAAVEAAPMPASTPAPQTTTVTNNIYTPAAPSTTVTVSSEGSTVESVPAPVVEPAMSSSPGVVSYLTVTGSNPCEGKKPLHSDAAGTDNYFSNVDCLIEGVTQAAEQSGTNVTKGYKGEYPALGTPILTTYKEAGLCPVNVHWHLGAEHLSVGQYDEHGKGPSSAHTRHLLAEGEIRGGFQCMFYDDKDAKFTTEYDWKHCVDTHVGETYEVHWPHSAAGDCALSGTITPWQYQSPFYDGVFCNDGVISLSPLNTFEKIGVQAQVFTIVNDETYYYPDLFKGMLVDEEVKGVDMSYYTGSTTGTSRSNTVCSRYTPITWQVDRTCHLISASSFDKMCADMLAQADDMTSDTHPHGARELVADEFAADNHQK